MCDIQRRPHGHDQWCRDGCGGGVIERVREISEREGEGEREDDIEREGHKLMRERYR